MTREDLVQATTDDAETAVRSPDRTLWCVNVIGPDDLYAAASLKHARECAHSLNQLIGERGHDDELEPNVWAVPAIWPWTPEDHAAGLLKQQHGMTNGDREVEPTSDSED